MVRIFRFPYQKPFIPAFQPLFSRVVLSKEELRKGPGDPVAAGEPQPSGTASCLGFGNAKRVTGNHFSFVSTKKWHKKKKWKKKRNSVFPVVTFLCLNFFTFRDKKEGKKRKKKLVTSHNQEQLFPGSRKKGKPSPRQASSGDASQRLDPEMRLFRKLILCLFTLQSNFFLSIISFPEKNPNYLSP